MMMMLMIMMYNMAMNPKIWCEAKTFCHRCLWRASLDNKTRSVMMMMLRLTKTSSLYKPPMYIGKTINYMIKRLRRMSKN